MKMIKYSWMQRCPVRIMLILFLQLTLFASQANAATYVYADKFYLANNIGRYKDAQSAINAVTKACMANYPTCTGSFTGESFNDSYNSVMYTYTLSYQLYYSSGPITVTNNYTSYVDYLCPTGYETINLKTSPGKCRSTTDPNYESISPPLTPQSKEDCDCTGNINIPNPNPTAGNPIVLGSGSKEEVETDYSNVAGTLFFTRKYRSSAGRWENNYQSFAATLATPLLSPNMPCVDGTTYAVGPSPVPNYVPHCYPYASLGTANDFGIRRPGGRIIYASSSNGYLPSADMNDRVAPTLDATGNIAGWDVTNGQTDAIEHYDLNGLMLSSTSRNGQVTSFVYSDASTHKTIAPAAGLLIKVADAFGKELNFTYGDNFLISKMFDPAGQEYSYAYDANNNLISVTYPTGEVRNYVYNELVNTANTKQLHALTGILDENNKRFATFKYDAQGWAISTEHAGGANKYVISYPSVYSSAKVTDPLGTTRTFGFTKKLNVLKNYIVYQLAANGGQVLGQTSYDDNGNISSYMNYNGYQTNYSYDLKRNLELSRTDAAGTANARTTTTAWHPTWRLPVKIAEPKRLTVLSYDTAGNLLTRTVQATTDATGAAGLNAVVVGPVQVWTYTYNHAGQVLTEKGPRTDISDLTNYAYDDAGNLTTITNALGHVTTLSDYDAHGRVGSVTNPNGQVTQLSYSPRGWLLSRTVGGEVTSFEYDDAGQLKRAVLPDNSAISYSYDDAHRLVQVSDSLGNSIAYVLDAMGNRTTESVKDAGGNLVRNTIRVYSALNKLKQQTGAY